MKGELYERILETELKYVRCFSGYIEEQKSITFKDSKLVDMYMHNFIFLKELIKKDELRIFIENKLEKVQRENKEYLHIMMDYGIQWHDLKGMIPAPEITEYCYMAITPKDFNKLKMKNDCFVRKADTFKILSDGNLVDIQANKTAMGEDFARKRIKRKMEEYKNNPNLNLYVCYKGDVPIGKCELLIEDGIAKIEDFDIIEEYQNQGYGTSVVRKLLEESFSENVDIAYLITDHFDTAKDMYKKCGFSICGIKTSILFDL
ncbi:GNAT family N-acetyltransferase [Clostridium sp. ZS2-4]|uniref:GNAT family N-acetyltransferase n=1 Tax=Clostridium sp. ZS2-4 TaxID=2987703 RepID=UPI00227BF0CB|nr:GNAT family N-acetyltransferase [Clostridium sp. ZS2-4]MCY6354472.1 GNAT family N-acetyltransferase [Clostridium sp. ZS2-4]